MFAEKYERYELAYVPEGLQISLWQALPSLGFGVIALVILAACFMTDPYHGHARIWAGLGVGVLALVALFGVKLKTWIISDYVIRYKGSLWSKEVFYERAPGTAVVLRMESVVRDSEGTLPPFPYVVHLIGPGGIEVGDGFRFRERSTLDRFIEALHGVSPIDVEDGEGRPKTSMSAH